MDYSKLDNTYYYLKPKQNEPKLAYFMYLVLYTKYVICNPTKSLLEYRSSTCEEKDVWQQWF